jgi:uncharacterized RDD family membrane protein YckC
MTGAELPGGGFLPPTPTPVDGAAHSVAAERAQAAAAARLSVRTAVPSRAARDYTGLVTRAIGFGIDALIIDLAAIVVVAIVALALNLFKVPSEVDTALAAIGAVVFVVWWAAYFVTFWSTTGQTPGARVMRFRVLAPGAPRGRIGPRRALVRLLAMILAAIPLLAGYFMVLFDDRRRGLHDRLARTVVVDAPDSDTPINRRRARRPAAAPDR